MTRQGSVINIFKQLQAALGTQQARQEAGWMTMELDRMKRISDRQATLDEWVQRRIRGEPLQYILGSQPFGPINIITRRPVLIPRPETEDWVAQLARRFDVSARYGTVSVLDLCTGTGCIPLMLCHIWPPGKVRATGVDISADAIELAQENLVKNGANGNEAEFVRGDLFDDRFVASLPENRGKFDIITCNPPYIPIEEYAKLPTSVKEWEDRRALIGEYPLRDQADTEPASSINTNGLQFYNRLAEIVPYLLQREESLSVLEFGEGQGEQVMQIMGPSFRKAELWKDQFGKERAFAGWT